MLLSETREYLLECSIILPERKRQILLEKPLDSSRNLGLVSLRLRLDADRVAGLREGKLREGYNSCRRADGIVCVYRHLGGYNNVAGGRALDLYLLLADKIYQLTDLFGGAGGGVEHFLVALKHSAYNLDEGHLSHERVGNRLEHERRKRLVGGAMDIHLVAGGVSRPYHLLVGCAGKKLGYLVEQKIHSAQVSRGNAGDGSYQTVDYSVVDAVYKLLMGKLLAVEELHHELLVSLRDSLGHSLDKTVYTVGRLRLSGVDKLSLGSVLVILHREKIVIGYYLAVLYERNDHRADGRTELGLELGQNI